MSKVQPTKSTRAGEMGGKIEVKEITPEIARALLERNHNNRPLRQNRIDEYAEEMTGGHWQMNGDTIRIAKNGDLIDGQHRLWACIEAKKSFLAIVVYDLDPEVFISIDSGGKRTMADHLAVRGVAFYTIIGAALGWVWRHDHDMLSAVMDSTGGGAVSKVKKRDLMDFYSRCDPEQWHRAALAADRCKAVAPVSMMCACHFIFQRLSPVRADEFVERLTTGAGLMRDDPVLRLRDRLIRDRHSRDRLPRGYVLALVFKAWNAYIEGRPVRHLRVFTNEAFPEPTVALAGD